MDANNLYGWAMVQNLPKYGFLWKEAEDFTPQEIDELIKKTREDIFKRSM